MNESIHVTSDFDVDLLMTAGSDGRICEAARVSTMGADSLGSAESEGLINFLMRNRHGSPFEHGTLQFRIYAPIFVWREFMRHRIGFSYNEQSGRYMELEPVFYVPPLDRPLVQHGKTGEYNFSKGTNEQYDICVDNLLHAYAQSWHNYKEMLNVGVAKEVARSCLPVSTYSAAYVTCNPRSLMSFLSLRTTHVDSKFPSYPQWEIERVARQMEAKFKEHFPKTHRAFDLNGRVAP